MFLALTPLFFLRSSSYFVAHITVQDVQGAILYPSPYTDLELVSPFIVTAIRVEEKLELVWCLECHGGRPLLCAHFLVIACLYPVGVCELQVVIPEGYRNRRGSTVVMADCLGIEEVLLY